MTVAAAPSFAVRTAASDADLDAAKRLRYDVFVNELGGTGDGIDHDRKLEQDRFDAYCDHLLLIDLKTDAIVGVYRIMRQEQAEAAGCFYSESEYDLSRLLETNRRLLELGRSCVHRDYRGGTALFHLWGGLADYVAAHRIELLFGVASFHGTDPAAFAGPLSLLHHRHLAPENLRVPARAQSFQRMDLIEEAALDRRAAMREMPSLIKAYLRLGGVVGQGAYVDHAFNTTDVCLILDTAQMNARQARMYRDGPA